MASYDFTTDAMTVDEARDRVCSGPDPFALAESLCEQFDLDLSDFERPCDDGCWASHPRCAVVEAVQLLRAMATLAARHPGETGRW
jgi:hypothetical protein